MLQTRKANPNKPPRILIYGAEGCGKSTLGARSDKPIFISPEGGTDQLVDVHGNPCEEMQNVDTWPRFREALEQLKKETHDFKTVVIDSLDWVESLAHADITKGTGKSIVTCHGGYGSGYRLSQTMHKEVIEDLSYLREVKGMGIVITAHAHVKAVKDPSMLHDYDQYEIKTHELVSSLFREWVDGLFFARFRTFTKEGETDKARALSDGSRVVYTVKQPSFQAKNRYGMPSEMDFTEDFWKEVKRYSRKGDTLEVVQEEILKLEAHITDEETRKTVTDFIVKAGNDVAKLIPIRDRLRQITGQQ